MVLRRHSLGLVVTGVVALLLLPAQYYVPDLYVGVQDPLLEQPESVPGAGVRNAYLGARVEQLRACDAQQEQLEVRLKMVQDATSEYNLLRQHRCLAVHDGPPSNCFFDKGLDEDFTF